MGFFKLEEEPEGGPEWGDDEESDDPEEEFDEEESLDEEEF